MSGDQSPIFTNVHSSMRGAYQALFHVIASPYVPVTIGVSTFQYAFFEKEAMQCEPYPWFIPKFCRLQCYDLGSYPALQLCDSENIQMLTDSKKHTAWLNAVAPRLGRNKVWVRSSSYLQCIGTGKVFNCMTRGFEDVPLHERHLVIGFYK